MLRRRKKGSQLILTFQILRFRGFGNSFLPATVLADEEAVLLDSSCLIVTPLTLIILSPSIKQAILNLSLDAPLVVKSVGGTLDC